MKTKMSSGFSLIELMVVISIMAVLAAIGLSSYKTANMKSRDARRTADIQEIRSAVEMYRSEEDVYPPDLDAAKEYFSNKVEPLDPKGKNYDYTQTGGGSGYTLIYMPELGTGTTYYNP